MIYVDLVLDNGELVRIEGANKIEDDLYSALENAIRLGGPIHVDAGGIGDCGRTLWEDEAVRVHSDSTTGETLPGPAPRERPILFSAPMVRAILSGAKTQTRRILKVQPFDVIPMPDSKDGWVGLLARDPPRGTVFACRHGQPGDRLWVREAWRAVREADTTKPSHMTAAHRIWYEADTPHQPGYGKLRPSMFMPRWASRITLELTGVRVERLQAISPEDAIAEGLKGVTKDGALVKYGIPDADGLPGTDDSGWPWHAWRISPVDAYQRLWEQINGAGSWAANPFVWVLEIKRIKP